MTKKNGSSDLNKDLMTQRTQVLYQVD